MNFVRDSYAPGKAYSYSKLCNVLMVTELAQRLKGTGRLRDLNTLALGDGGRVN